MVIRNNWFLTSGYFEGFSYIKGGKTTKYLVPQGWDDVSSDNGQMKIIDFYFNFYF